MVVPKGSKASAAPKSPPSPKKARHAPSMRDTLKKKNEKPVPTIVVHAFQDPVTVEAYAYILLPTKDGFINKYRMWSKGELEVPTLIEANFGGLKAQRDKNDNGNEPLLNEDGYSRFWMIRYPNENESTIATRKEGLRVLKNFFMSKIATSYPPSNIITIDKTLNDPAILEDFFLDQDIEEIIRASFDSNEIKPEFFANYTAFSHKIYCKREPSAFAKDMLGFPSLP